MASVVGFGSFLEWKFISAKLPVQQTVVKQCRAEVQKSRKRSKAPRRKASVTHKASYMFWQGLWSREAEAQEMLMHEALRMPTGRQTAKRLLRFARMYALA